MYNIILFIIALCLVVVFFYIILKNSKKKYKNKEGFTIGDNNNLATSSLTDSSTYADNLGSIIGQLNVELNLDVKRDEYTKILKLQSEVIQLYSLKSMLSWNLNQSPESLLALNFQILNAFNDKNQTAPDYLINEVLDTSGTPSSSGGIFTNLLGLNNI